MALRPSHPGLPAVPSGQRRPGEGGRRGPRGPGAARPWALPVPGSPRPHAARDSLGHRNTHVESLLVKRVRENTRSHSARDVCSFPAFPRNPWRPPSLSWLR